MNVEKAEAIIKLVDGCEIRDGLATICIALIHAAATHGYTKQEALDAMAGQWDLYEKRQATDERLN